MNEDKTEAVKKSSFDAMVIDIAIRLAFIGLLAYWSLKLIGPFVLVVLWGVILAVTLYPVYAWLKIKFGGRGGIAATLITLVFLAILIGPASLLVHRFHGIDQLCPAPIAAQYVVARRRFNTIGGDHGGAS